MSADRGRLRTMRLLPFTAAAVPLTMADVEFMCSDLTPVTEISAVFISFGQISG